MREIKWKNLLENFQFKDYFLITKLIILNDFKRYFILHLTILYKSKSLQLILRIVFFSRFYDLFLQTMILRMKNCSMQK